MRITPNGIRPCSACYKARQMLKDATGVLHPTPPTHLRVTTNIGDFLIDRANGHKVIEAPALLFDTVGIQVYIAGKRIIDVASAEPLAGVAISQTEKLWL